MIKKVKTAAPEDTVSTAVEKMNRYGIGCLVVAEKRTPIGIMTERDVLNRIVLTNRDPTVTRVQEVMSQPLVTVDSKTTIQKAVRLMLRHRIKKLVVANTHRLVGVLSLTDLLPLLEETDLGDNGLKKTPRRMRRIFQLYYDPKRQIRKNCPLTMASGTAITCIAQKCMWYVDDHCVFLDLAERVA
jgi:CBS-domain-containing membrane protein